MSYLNVFEMDKKTEIFGKSRRHELVRAAHAPLLGQLPIDPELARLCHEGNIESYEADIITTLGQSLTKTVSVWTK